MHFIPETSLKFLDQISGIEGASILEKEGVDCALTVVMSMGAEIIVGRALPAQPQQNIGRRLSLQNPAISRTHCVFGMDRGGVYVKDVGTGARGSTNGTFINDRRLEPGQKLYVNANDTITLGKPQLPFEVVVRLVVKQQQTQTVDFFSPLRMPALRPAH